MHINSITNLHFVTVFLLTLGERSKVRGELLSVVCDRPRGWRRGMKTLPNFVCFVCGVHTCLRRTPKKLPFAIPIQFWDPSVYHLAKSGAFLQNTPNFGAFG